MTTLNPRLESFFSIKNLWIGRGEETPQFECILVIKGRDVAVAKNAGRGGCNTYLWKEPFNFTWANEKLFPLAAKVASAKEPDFKDLYSKSPSTALDSLVFDAVETARVERSLSRRRGSFRSENLDGETRNASFDEKAQWPSASTSGGPGLLKRGVKVEFGRSNGEKTVGKVLKVNRKSVIVEALESRGSKHAPGTKFRVAPSLLTILP